MNKIFEIALGIVTSIGGFLDVGAIATAAEAGSEFGFQLIWAIILGTICVIFLVEMSGCLAAVSKHTLAAAVRERFGINFYIIPLIAEVVVDFLILGSEIGGVCIALQLLTGIGFQWFALPVAVASIASKWGAKQSEPFRIPWSKVRDIGIDVEVDVEAEATPALDYEKWLRDHIIARIPGGG
ncbi:divalent metal cation transporter [Nostoc sp.]|uniref:divalent metal cation transporter n=1 Tax=Nostoc sp. TaxID=1180 RepID=UPI002FF6279D